MTTNKPSEIFASTNPTLVPNKHDFTTQLPPMLFTLAPATMQQPTVNVTWAIVSSDQGLDLINVDVPTNKFPANAFLESDGLDITRDQLLVWAGRPDAHDSLKEVAVRAAAHAMRGAAVSIKMRLGSTAKTITDARAILIK